MKLSLDQIKDLLPHREPFLFIDEVIDTRDKDTVIAKKSFLKSDSFFKGHFPGNPVVPGVLLIETMAQTAIILYYLNKSDLTQKKPLFYLGKVKAEFLAPATPDCTLFITATAVKLIESAGIVNAIVTLNDKIIAKAELVFGVKLND